MHAVQKFRVRGVDVDDALVRADFELFAAVFIFVRRAQNGDHFFFGGQGDGAADLGARLLHRFDDALRREVYEFMIVSGEFDSQFLTCHSLLIPPILY